MKKYLLLFSMLVVLVFTGSMCTSEDTKTVTVTNTPKTTNTVEEKTTLKLDNTQYEPGGAITVTLDIASTEKLTNTAWVGVIPSDVEHGDEAVNDENDSDYVYINTATDDQVSLEAPMEVGKYDVRLNSADTGDTAEEITYISFEVVE